MVRIDSTIARVGFSIGSLPPIRLDHMKRMTDDTGIYQHALYTIPDPHHGYTTDDNARALIVATQYSRLRLPEVEQSTDLCIRYLTFLRYAQRPDGRFHNFLAYDRTWLDEHGSEDSHGRAIWSLGYLMANTIIPGAREAAGTLLERALPWMYEFNAPRAQAFALLGIGWAYHGGYSQDALLSLARELASNLADRWHETAGEDWQWFEDTISYSNAKLSEALFHAYLMLEDEEYLELALRSLDFLIDVCFDGDMLDLVGQNGWYRRGQKRALFDQQPVDAQAMVQACLAAYETTGEGAYLEHAYNAFQWFLGNNRLGQPICDRNTGGCFDGIHPDRVNRNQGAESTLAYLLARLDFELPTVPKSPKLDYTTSNAFITAC